eukprot:gene41500-33247_t
MRKVPSPALDKSNDLTGLVVKLAQQHNFNPDVEGIYKASELINTLSDQNWTGMTSEGSEVNINVSQLVHALSKAAGVKADEKWDAEKFGARG